VNISRVVKNSSIMRNLSDIISQVEKLSLDKKTNEILVKSVERLYTEKMRSLLSWLNQELNETLLREAVNSFLEIIPGNYDVEILQRRIELGRKLRIAEVTLEQLVTAYGLLLERWNDELCRFFSNSDRRSQLLKYSELLLFFDLGLLLHGYEGEVARQMRIISKVDVLTGVLSRRKFEEELQLAIELAQRKKQEFSLLWIDIDNIRLINDVYGYTVADVVLKSVADFLQEFLPDAFAIGRIGGDDFGFILLETGRDEALAKAYSLCRGITELKISPVKEEGVFITASIGVALYPGTGQALDDILLAAEIAQLEAKKKGRNTVQIVDSGDDKNTHSTVVHEKILLLQDALNSKGDVVPFYQPIVDLETGKPLGYEVLARVRRGNNFLSAGFFAEAAEQSGLMKKIGKIVIEQAVREKSEPWAKDMLFFINFSMREVENRETPRILADLFKSYGIRPEEIVAEITERQAVRDLNAVQAFAREMLDIGVRLAVDDFGSGFSSFMYLRYFDCYFAKIEGSLVSEITRSGRARMIVENMVKLLQGLSIEVVAEWVENRETAEILRRAGVRYGQGFYLGKPLRYPGEGNNQNI